MTEQKFPKSMYVPPGQDPTEFEYPLERPKVRGCLGTLQMVAIYGFAIYGFLALWQASQKPKMADATRTPTATITQTLAPPTLPIYPTPAPRPARSTASTTPVMTPTVAPPPPGSLATWTPGPWLATKFQATYDSRFSPTGTPTGHTK